MRMTMGADGSSDFWNVCVIIARRIRCSIDHAVFCVTPISAASPREVAFLGSFATIRIAAIHLSIGTAESSNIVSERRLN